MGGDHDDYDAIAITDDGECWASEGFERLIARGEACVNADE